MARPLDAAGATADSGLSPPRTESDGDRHALGGQHDPTEVAATDEAKRLNVFDAPTFVASDEVFWGDDRVDDAIRWAKSVG